MSNLFSRRSFEYGGLFISGNVMEIEIGIMGDWGDLGEWKSGRVGEWESGRVGGMGRGG